MVRRVVRGGLVLWVSLWGSGCVCVSRGEGVRVVRVWEGPVVGEGWREDGEGPFPAEWPVYAAVVQSREQGGYLGPMSDATLVMGVSEERERSAAGVLAGVRYAVPCRMVGLTGCWMALGRQRYAFVLVEDSGGTAGFRVRVIGHGCGYSLADGYQEHSFGVELEAYSKLPAMVGDVDGNGGEEVLVAPQDYLTEGVVPTQYEVYAWDGEVMRQRGRMGVDVVEKMGVLRRIGGG